MSHKVVTFTLLLATLLTGLIAGFFYTWSFTIMQSLNLVEESVASTAMVSINENIRTPWFAAIFFGAPVAILLSCLLVASSHKRGMSWLFIALLFSVGTLAITFTQHLPLNDQLANGMAWSDYFAQWVNWNHVRMGTSLIAFACMLLSLLRQSRRSKR